MGNMRNDNVTVPDLPVAHIDDPASLAWLPNLYARLHGDDCQVAVRTFRGSLQIYPMPGRLVALFMLRTTEAGVSLYPGDLVRGPNVQTRCQPADGDLYAITERTWESLQAGDTVCVDGHARSAATLTGRGVYFEMSVPLTPYQAPRLTLLRNVKDRPGGCAAYPGAFRREALPPVRPAPADPDQRGVNRVNMHALDMRTDREPPPSRHYHGPVPVGTADPVSHSETALILPRSVYGLPDHDRGAEEHVMLYGRPQADPQARVTVPVRPGSIVVTPGAADWTMGHSFANAFALLVAVPGFVSPYRHLT